MSNVQNELKHPKCKNLKNDLFTAANDVAEGSVFSSVCPSFCLPIDVNIRLSERLTNRHD